jgi:type IV pilus assembly protein PilE
MRRAQRGFTLIEAMITVAIIAILAAIAIPSYRDYVTRGKLTEAFGGLADARVKMEQYFQDNRTYATGGCTTGTPSATQVQVQTLKNFTLDCGTPTATTYTITATGINDMVGFSYTMDQNNSKTSTFSGSGSSAGWTAASPNNCWVVRKGGVC